MCPLALTLMGWVLGIGPWQGYVGSDSMDSTLRVRAAFNLCVEKVPFNITYLFISQRFHHHEALLTLRRPRPLVEGVSCHLAPRAKNSLTGKEYFLFLSVGCWCHYWQRIWVQLAPPGSRSDVRLGPAPRPGPGFSGRILPPLSESGRVGSGNSQLRRLQCPGYQLHDRSWVKTHVLSIILELKLGPTDNTPDGGINVSIKSSDVSIQHSVLHVVCYEEALSWPIV